MVACSRDSLGLMEKNASALETQIIPQPQEEAGTATSRSAAMFTGGWVTAVTVASSAGLPVVSLGAGCLYVSLGFLYLLYCSIWHGLRLPAHSPSEDSLEAAYYLLPPWLDTRVLNWGVVGRVGVGKSSLVNALRGVRANHASGAAVGIGHTTWHAQPYHFSSGVDWPAQLVRLWDLPGAGTLDWPSETYIMDSGLRYFDGLLFVISDACLESELAMLRQLRHFQVPHYVVRSKIDQDVINNAEDNSVEPAETLAEVRYELSAHGCEPSRTFVISSRHADYDFDDLLYTFCTEVIRQCEEIFGPKHAVKR